MNKVEPKPSGHTNVSEQTTATEQTTAAEPTTGRRRHPDAALRIDARRRRKREKLLNAAQETLDERGPHDMSLRAVARAAGCAPATIYEYFDSLFALLDALAERPRSELRAYLAAAAADSTDMAGDLMIRLAMAYVRFARRRPKAFRLIFETLAPSQSTDRKPTDLHPMIESLLTAARAGRMSGEIHPDDSPERIAWGLWALAHGIATLRASASQQSSTDSDDIDVSALQAYVRGWMI